MAFLLYFVVILVSAASVMFGLDLMTSPLPSTPNVPIGRSAHVAPAQVGKPVREAKRESDSRALSPVYPAHPDAPAAPIQTTQSQTKSETNGSATRDAAAAQNKSTPSRPPAEASSAPAQQRAWLPPEQQPPSSAPAPQQASSAPARQQATSAAVQQNAAPSSTSTEPPPAQNAAAEPAADKTAATEAAAAQSKGHCDIQACSAAYHSFRASDCSYQPYGGARQVCTRLGSVASAEARPAAKAVYGARRPQLAATARGAGDSHELDEVTRIVRKMTRGREGDVAVQDSQGRIIVVHPDNARAYADDFGD